MNKYELVYDLKEHLDTYSQTYDDYIMSYGEADMIYHYIEEKDKEIKRLKGVLQTHEILLKSNTLEIERLNNKLKDIKSQLDYLETYSSKEDVFEDMRRRLDRIESIVNRKR